MTHPPSTPSASAAPGAPVRAPDRPADVAGAMVCLFAKPPYPGTCKTRLAATVGDAHAAQLATAFLHDTAAQLDRLTWAQWIWATTDTGPAWDAAQRHKTTGPQPLEIAQRWPQGEGDLGARMSRVMRRALEQGADEVYAVGADTPGLPDAMWSQACEALKDHDAVIGPSEDGGFYLLGIKAAPEGLFDDVPWSSERTLEATLARMRALQWSVKLLPSWFDIDHIQDLDRLQSLLRCRRLVAPETLQALDRLQIEIGQGLTASPPRPNAQSRELGSRISLIIPTLNEARRITAYLGRARHLPGIHEIIVVDGGSEDGTAEAARSVPGVLVASSEPCRATQMNHGATLATGDTLLFVHADTELPHDAAWWVDSTLQSSQCIAGAFRTWTCAETRAEGGGWKLGALLHIADLRSRYSGLPYGDQCLFLRSATFHEMGGYAEVKLMEDLEFAQRLRHHGHIRTVPCRVTVSGRRFQQHPVGATFLVNLLPLLYRFGVPPDLLAKVYRQVR